MDVNVLLSKDSVVMYLAAYLYAMTEDFENKTPLQHIEYFVDSYLEYKDSIHSGDCTKQPWSCAACWIQSYLDLAESMLDLNKFDEHVIDMYSDLI